MCIRDSFTRGMTVCDFRAAALGRANAQVAMSADGPAVVELLLRVVKEALGSASVQSPGCASAPPLS